MNIRGASPGAAAWLPRLAGAALVVGVAAVLARVVAAGDNERLALGALALALVTVMLAGAANWRTGLYLFLGWLLFEDLPRKFLGNNMVIYFGKDVLVAMTYAGFAVAQHRGRLPLPRLAFGVPLAVFIGLGVLQVFNPLSPSLLYGLLGVKLYFYYVPLVFVGYALFRSQAELSGFLTLFSVLALVIAALGIAQGIIGLDFLNPAHLAPELESLGREIRTAPISGLQLPRATSVFVSEGRQGSFMLLAFVLTSGAAVHLGIRRDRWQSVSLVAAAVTLAALMFHGSRAGVLYALLSLLVLAVAFIGFGGYPRAVRRRVASRVAGVALVVVVIAGTLVARFPAAVAARWALYSESISPWSPASELGWRIWGYPAMNLRGAIESGHVLLGQGIGTASLGVQYVRLVFGAPPPPPPVESGFGTLALELGVLGPALWLAWSIPLVYSGARIVRALRGTPVFPVGFSILWFAFLLLFPLTYGALNPYQNYLYNAFFWLLVGVLHRLPALAAESAEGGARPWTP